MTPVQGMGTCLVPYGCQSLIWKGGRKIMARSGVTSRWSLDLVRRAMRDLCNGDGDNGVDDGQGRENDINESDDGCANGHSRDPHEYVH